MGIGKQSRELPEQDLNPQRRESWVVRGQFSLIVFEVMEVKIGRWRDKPSIPRRWNTGGGKASFSLLPPPACFTLAQRDIF